MPYANRFLGFNITDSRQYKTQISHRNKLVLYHKFFTTIYYTISIDKFTNIKSTNLNIKINISGNKKGRIYKAYVQGKRVSK